MTTLCKTKQDLLELFSHEQIQDKIKEIAGQINKDFADCEELYIIGILRGAVLFVSDLVRHIDIPVQIEFIRLSSYGNDEKSTGKVKPVDLTLPSLEGKHVLIVEDIVDTGLTANFLIDYIKLQHNAETVKFVTLLDKSCARKHDVTLDYTGFTIDDKFVVGYGMDYAGHFRNLSYIGYFPG